MPFVATRGRGAGGLVSPWEAREFGSSPVGLGKPQVEEGLEKSERGDVASENLGAPLVSKSLFVKQVIK